MKKVAFHNLGCKVNSYELDIMRQILQEQGYEEVPFQERADIYVINTCTVTNIADRKSRQMLHRAKKQNPGAVVIAAGCYVETDPAGVERDDAVDLVIGNNKKSQIGRILAAFLEERAGRAAEDRKEGGAPGPSPDPGASALAAAPAGGASAGGASAVDASAGDSFAVDASAGDASAGGASAGKASAGEENPFRRSAPKPCFREDLTAAPAFEDMQLRSPGHTRAYIKIQDGCNQFCSYCIIPFARGRIRSRKAEEILREVEGLVRGGIREIVLTGIHVSSYGLDFGAEGPVRFDPARSGAALLELIRKLNAVEGLERIRLSSLEPRIMTEAFIVELSRLEKVCPHFHLSLQSGCDQTLRRMNRHYTTAEYAESVRLLRRYYDRPAITTDVIVGFPGETEAEFQTTCDFLEEIRFYEIHVFRYSKRNGTVAAKMEFQIPEPVKAVRSDRLLEMTAAQAKEYRQLFAGQPETILLEEPCRKDGITYWTGSTARYVTGAVRCGDSGKEYCPGMLLQGSFSGETVELSRGSCALVFTPV